MQMPVFISRKKMEARIARRVMEAIEQITREMGAELHDNLAQKMSTIGLELDGLRKATCFDVDTEVQLIKVKSAFTIACYDVEGIVRQLGLERMEEDTLVQVLENQCKEMESPRRGRVHFSHEGEPPAPMDPYVEQNILRMMQELVHNAFKHSSAWNVWVRLKQVADQLILEVEDDGSGFSEIEKFIGRLKKRNNSLKMRAQTIGAKIEYKWGKKGLLARMKLRITRS